MKSGADLLTEMENENKYFPLIKERQCLANPNLSGFMSVWIISTETEDKIRTRLLQMALVLFEIIGAGDKSDSDYVSVSMDSTVHVKISNTEFNIDDIKEKNPDLYRAIKEAKIYIKTLNNVLNEENGDNIDFDFVWNKLKIFLNAYWIEKQKTQG